MLHLLMWRMKEQWDSCQDGIWGFRHNAADCETVAETANL